jgi:hypothetical protein
MQGYQLLFIQKLSTINIAAIGTHPSKFTVYVVQKEINKFSNEKNNQQQEI